MRSLLRFFTGELRWRGFNTSDGIPRGRHFLEGPRRYALARLYLASLGDPSVILLIRFLAIQFSSLHEGNVLATAWLLFFAAVFAHTKGEIKSSIRFLMFIVSFKVCGQELVLPTVFRAYE